MTHAQSMPAPLWSQTSPTQVLWSQTSVSSHHGELARLLCTAVWLSPPADRDQLRVLAGQKSHGRPLPSILVDQSPTHSVMTTLERNPVFIIV